MKLSDWKLHRPDKTHSYQKPFWYRADTDTHDPARGICTIEVEQSPITGCWYVYWENDEMNDLYYLTPHPAHKCHNLEQVKEHIDQFWERAQKIIAFL